MATLEESSFLSFSNICEKVKQTKSKIAKTRIVSEYLLGLKYENDLQIAATFLSGRVFPVGQEFGEANVGYSMIWSVFAEFSGMREDELSTFYMKHGDLGSAIEDALRSFRSKQSSSPSLLFRNDLSLSSVYSSFAELSRSSGKGSTQRRKQILTRLFASSNDPVETKYIVRLLTGEMRIGLVEGLVEEAVAKAFSKSLDQVRTARLVTGDIGLVADLARRGRLDDARIELFRPTTFMLADSGQDATDVRKKLEGKSMLAEFKYDGIRAQIHSSRDVTKIFSRNLEDVTDYFPEIKSAIQELKLSGVIFDGEIIAFENGKPKSFQSLQRRLRKKESSSEDTPIKYVAFDLLYLEKPLIEEPLSERSRLLRTFDFRGVLDFSEQRSVKASGEIQRVFEESKTLGFEGLVVKDASSPYTPGRRGQSWVKLKKELDTLDVVIVAAEFGHGKRAGVISDYTFAVRDGPELKTVGKAYSGLTDQEIREMTDLLKEITLKDFGYRRTVKPIVVLEVAFDAIQRSERHNGGYALRFPRIKRIRSDKSVEDIDTIERVKQIYEAQTVKI